MSVQHREHTAVMSTANKAVSSTELKMYERILSRRSAPKLTEADADADAETEYQKLHAACSADGGKCAGAEHTADDGGINQIIHLLQEVAEQKRYRKLQDKLEGLTLCHTFCHENHPKIPSLFLTFLFYHTFFILAMAELRILHVVFHTFCVNCGKSARFAKKGKTVGEKVFPAKLTKEKF